MKKLSKYQLFDLEALEQMEKALEKNNLLKMAAFDFTPISGPTCFL